MRERKGTGKKKKNQTEKKTEIFLNFFCVYAGDWNFSKFDEKYKLKDLKSPMYKKYKEIPTKTHYNQIAQTQ